mmetsp:Transcript_30109/g.56874  ORF Transcript_30109/g.56874 Transcript_30109/m.56874 type:complete len:350 (-) Transcript_30109:305-1354(-)
MMFSARYLRPSQSLPSYLLHPARIRSHYGRLFSSTSSTSDGTNQEEGEEKGQSRSRRRIRVVSCDVTGTLVSFLGKIEHHYGNAARTCGVTLPPTKISSIGPCFNRAYVETSMSYPCFGNSEISAKDWWRRCVGRSFELVGTSMTEEEQERVFQRVYSKFGSHAAYGVFPDAIPFLKWCHRRGIVTGVVSNADERYGDSILPMLGLGDDMRFLTFSKNVGFEKPGKEIFQAAMKQSEPWLCLVNNFDRDNNNNDDPLDSSKNNNNSPSSPSPPLKPEEVLHIGNDFKKDYIGAKNAGFHAVLLDRYDEKELAKSWRQKGAPVFKDLVDVVEYLGHERFELGPLRTSSSE